HAFASQFGGDASQPSDISARPRKARDQPRTDGISRLGHDDWDFPRRSPRRQGGGREPRDDDVDLKSDQLRGQFGKPVDLSFCRSKFKPNVLSLNIAELAQSLTKLPPKLFRADIANNQCADGRHLRLLRSRRERPRSRAAERDQQFPPSDGDCHTPLPCEVRKGNDTTTRASRLHVRRAGMLVASTAIPAASFLRTPPSRPRASRRSRALVCGPHAAQRQASTAMALQPGPLLLS